MANTFINPPDGLLEKIMYRIHVEERVLALRKIIIFSIIFIASIISIIPAYTTLLSDLSSTGFLNFFSLIFSDFSSITSYWKSFSMILLETIPALSLAIFLAIFITFLQSIISLTKNAKIIIHTKQYATR